MTAASPLHLLMSRQAAQDFGDRIADILRGRPYRCIHLEDAPGPDGRYATDIAFLTREVTGSSGKQQLTPELTRFYEILRASPRLAWMQSHAAGADRPIYAELQQRGVALTTGAGANAGPVAQMALTGLLMLARRMPELMDAQRRHAWEPLLGARAPRDLKDETALIVGLGAVGREIARLLRALGMRTIGVRRADTPSPDVDESVSFANLSGVLPRADWLVLACPLTDDTRGLVDAALLAQLPAGARLVNVARGDVVVEADLADALRGGRLGGAYLDVLVQEPLPAESPLWALPNTLITPHTAGHTRGHYAAVGDIFLDNLARWRDGGTLRNLVG